MSKTPPPESQPTKSVVSEQLLQDLYSKQRALEDKLFAVELDRDAKEREVHDLMESKQGLESRLAESERANKEWERKKELIIEDMKSLKTENKKLSTSLDYHNSKAQAFEKMKKERERLELDNQELLLSIEKMQEETTVMKGEVFNLAKLIKSVIKPDFVVRTPNLSLIIRRISCSLCRHSARPARS